MGSRGRLPPLSYLYPLAKPLGKGRIGLHLSLAASYGMLDPWAEHAQRCACLLSQICQCLSSSLLLSSNTPGEVDNSADSKATEGQGSSAPPYPAGYALLWHDHEVIHLDVCVPMFADSLQGMHNAYITELAAPWAVVWGPGLSRVHVGREAGETCTNMEL